MDSTNSLSAYMGRMVKRYSSLFTLPSEKEIILYLCVLCVVWGVLAILPFQLSLGGFALGLILGISLFLINLSSNFVISRLLLAGDPIFDYRRCSALSFFSSLTWLGITILGSILSLLLENPIVWIKLFLLGSCAVLMLRWTVLSTTSFANSGRVSLSAVLPPALSVVFMLLMASAIGFRVTPFLFLFMPLSIIVIGLAIHLFTFLIDRTGKKMIGIPSLSLFKAFVASWTEDLNMPLEKFFERLGDKRDVELSLLAFRGDKAMKAMIVVPAFHPGPFRNVGSSLFPSMVQEALEKKLRCAVSVPHGLFGHDLDLSSQAQSLKVIASVLDYVEFPSFETRATPFVRVERNEASASCQIFGDYAFVTLTLAPEMMEDLPEGLNSAIVREAKKRGLSPAIIIDAHNSIDGQFNLEKAVDPLRMAAVASLEAALSCQRCPFLVGASRVVPEEFGVEEGMGPGGISVVVLEVDTQKTAYVTIDGNNMISGLREKILSTLRELGIDEGEILTTDTHAVNGVVLTPRGYHPIGEAMDQSKLIKYAIEAVTKALNSLEPAKVSWYTKTIPEIRVIGEKQIEALCALTEKAAEQAKRLALTLFPVTGILLTILLAFV
ncbi:MAG: DUF2070 family protein [Candidatus Bathyarchaeota archaeon]|nr:MAG: DUF2070 family protein [Candidatus Bathyarchaeota archaeon]